MRAATRALCCCLLAAAASADICGRRQDRCDPALRLLASPDTLRQPSVHQRRADRLAGRHQRHHHQLDQHHRIASAADVPPARNARTSRAVSRLPARADVTRTSSADVTRTSSADVTRTSSADVTRTSSADVTRTSSADVTPQPVTVVHGVLLEPWLNASTRHRRRFEAGEPAPEDVSAVVRRHALIAATLLNAVQARSVGADDLLRELAQLAGEPDDRLERSLNVSVAALRDHSRSRDIRLEALVLEVKAGLLETADAVRRLAQRADNSSADIVRTGRFINGVTAAVDGRLRVGERVRSALEADVARLNASLAELDGRLGAAPRRQDEPLAALDRRLADASRGVAELRALCSASPPALPARELAELTSQWAAERSQTAALRRQVARLRETGAVGRRRLAAAEVRADGLESRLQRLQDIIVGLHTPAQTQLQRLQLWQDLQRLRTPEHTSRVAAVENSAGSEEEDDEDELGETAESGQSLPADALASDPRPAGGKHLGLGAEGGSDLGARSDVPDADLRTATSEVAGQLLLRSGDTSGTIVTADSLVHADHHGGTLVLGSSVHVGNSISLDQSLPSGQQTPQADPSSQQTLQAGQSSQQTPQADRFSQQTPQVDQSDQQTLQAGQSSQQAGQSSQQTLQAGQSSQQTQLGGTTLGSASRPDTGGWRPVQDRQLRRLPPQAPPSPAQRQPAGRQAAPTPTDRSPLPAGSQSKEKKFTGLRAGRKKPTGPKAAATRPVGAVVVVDPHSRQAWRSVPDAGGVWRRTVLDCWPAKKYSRLEGMRDWCLANCPINCPRTHCVCKWGRRADDFD